MRHPRIPLWPDNDPQEPEMVQTHLEELRKHMNLKYGIASPSTITRMLNGIDEELALYAFMEWIGEIVESRNTHLAIDGKALCGATEKRKVRQPRCC